MNKNETTLIRTQNLKKFFRISKGVLHAVDGIDLSIKRGKTLGLVGESGCGKSTLGRLMLRLLKPTEGAVFFNGEDITEFTKSQMRHFQQQAQIIFQDPYSSINPRMTVSATIEDPMIVMKKFKTKAERKQRVEQLMDTVGLAKRLYYAYPHELDGGRLQRVGIARALALEPQFIVCDEPVSALDVSIQAQILNLLMDLQEQMDLTYLFITHDLSVVKHISDEIAVMYLGKCVEKAPKNELFSTPKHPYTKALLSSILIPSLAARNKKKELLHGEVTNPVDPPNECRFAARCKYVMKVCRESIPELKEVTKEHYVACRLYE